MKAEAEEDGRDFIDLFQLKDEEAHVLYKMFIEDRGLHMQLAWDKEDQEHYAKLKEEGQTEDPEERKAREEARDEEWLAFVREKFDGVKIRKRRPPLTPH